MKSYHSLCLLVHSNCTNAQDAYLDLPETWQATSAFINYKSDASLPDNAQAYAASQQSCQSRVENNLAGVVYSNCDVNLEEAESKFHNNIAGNSVTSVTSPIVFFNCIVRYRGGQLFQGQSVVLQRSLLRLEISLLPSVPAIVVMKTLMTADLNQNTVKLNL
jgi:hypothetical protein